MSLQLWLPLNGDLTNNGLMDIEMTCATPSWSDAGKIGKCANFNGSINNMICSSTTKFNYTDNVSFALWLYHTGVGSTQAYAFTIGRADMGGYGYGIRIVSSTQIGVWFGSHCATVNCSANTWHHVVGVMESEWFHVYIDGALKYSTNNLSKPTYSDGGGVGLGGFRYASGNLYSFVGRINDFRIYDHCLSRKEVKEISKGLMLHYPLDNNGMGCKNIVAGNFNAVATQSGNTNTGTLYINKSDIGGSLNNLIGKTLVFSYEVSAEGSRYYVNTSDLRPRFGIHGTMQYVANGSSATVYPFADYLMYSGGARKVVMKYTIPSTWTSISNFIFALQDTNRPAAGNTATWYIKNCKLEIADEATSWCPNEADELYSQLGMDDNIEYDTSGYGNNGTKIGTLNYESNSPRHQSATYFNGTNSGIYKIPTCLTSTSSDFTISFWYKPTAVSNGAILNCRTLTGEGVSVFWVNQRLRFDTGSSALWSVSSTLSLNTWYHIVFTRNGNYKRYYVNGVLKESTTTPGVLTTLGKYMSVGISSSDDVDTLATRPNPLPGNLSDFRIYATCLSDSDIQELYNKPISIDNNGNLFAQEIIEEASSGSKFEKTGTVRADNISRCLYNYFTYDGPMYTGIQRNVDVEKLVENNGLKLTCNSTVTTATILHRMQSLMFNGASGNFKVEFDAYSTNPVSITCDICDKGFGVFSLTTTKQHFSGVAYSVAQYNTNSAYNGFFDIEASSIPLGTEIYITNIVIAKNTPKSIGSNYIVMDDIIEN
jgi:hypothetical protein